MSKATSETFMIPFPHIAFAHAGYTLSGIYALLACMTRIREPAKPKTPHLRRKLELRRFKGDLTGKALIVAMQASPCRNIDIEPGRTPMPVRKVWTRRQQ